MPADEGGARRSDRGRSHSVSPQRTAPPPQRRNSGGLDGAPSSWRRGSSSFGHSSRLQRESRGATGSADRAAGIGLSERQSLNILQSMGQSVHIFDLEGRIIYWSVARSCLLFSVLQVPFPCSLLSDGSVFFWDPLVNQVSYCLCCWRLITPVKCLMIHDIFPSCMITVRYIDNGRDLMVQSIPLFWLSLC